MDRKHIDFRVTETVFAVFTLGWLFLPGILGDPWFQPWNLPALLGGTEPGMGIIVLSWAILCILAAMALSRIASWFLKDRVAMIFDPARPLSMGIDSLMGLAIVLIQLGDAFSRADSLAFFALIPWYWYATAAIALAWNGMSLVRLVHFAGSVNESYREYLEFREKASNRRDVKTRLRTWGIQRRLVLSFTILIFLVIFVLSTVLLQDFGDTLGKSVEQQGFSLSEHGASIVKSSIGDRITVQDYLDVEAAKNATSRFPFKSLSYITRDRGTNKPVVRASTGADLIGTARKEEDYEQESTSMTREDGLVLFRSPATYAGRYLGYIELLFEDSVIMGPVHRTQAKTLLIGLIFIYLSGFIVYLFARNIVIPILFLRMSVNAISDSLSAMIHGGSKVSSDQLEYKDRVQTSDEIKALSREIGSMTGVIKGLIPYISSSTFKAADRTSRVTEKKDLAFLFTDIRGFTTLCEGHKPEEVVEMLNHYLEIQSSVILAHNGDIDKFVGDEIMATFEGPDKEVNAGLASLAIRKVMAQEKEIAENQKRHVVSIGIGINSGEVIFGSVGAKDRMDFTSIGDTVNLAARLEGANKTYGTKTLITEAVFTKVKDRLLCREIDLLTVKGKAIPARIYEILAPMDSVPEAAKVLKRDFEKALGHYRAMEWDKAEALLQGLEEKYGDETSRIFLNRVALYRKDPPAQPWDGVFNLTVK